MALDAAGARQPPGPVPKAAERAQQNLVTFSRRDRRDRNQVPWISRSGTCGQRCAIGARLEHHDRFVTDAVTIELDRDCTTRDDHMAGGRKRPTLARFESDRLLAADADLGGERKMDERDKAEPRGFALGFR